MPAIRFLPEDRVVESEPQESILDAAIRAGIDHTHACGGEGRCSTCRVHVIEGIDNCAPRTARESLLAVRLHFDDSVRLACQTRIVGHVTVRRLIIDATDAGLVDQRLGVARRRPVGEERRLAILFADLRGFTALTHALMPFDVVHVLNRFLDAAGTSVEDHSGQVVTYTGDGFMALFGLEQAETVSLDAVTAANAILRDGDQLAGYVAELHHRVIGVSVGVHTGPAIVGTIGRGPAARQTAIGDAVNVASRVEGANRVFGTRFLISRQTRDDLPPEVQTRHVGPVELRGQPKPLDLYEVTAIA